MKRLLLFSALMLVTSMQAFSQGSNPRRVLVEEFTNTGCPPCAATDPAMEAFEAMDISQICVVRWHTSWPDPGDPFYVNTKSVEGAAGIDPRIQTYYGANGVPYLRFSGVHGDYATDFPPQALPDPKLYKAVADSVYALKSPYKISIVQSLTADSIFADVTVAATDAVPTLSDLRLAVVFGERYNPYHGSNGRPFYTSIVRKVVPGITSGGAIAVSALYPAFSQTNGSTKTYRYGAKIGSTWNRGELMAVAFIQSAGTKEVFQSNWTVPSITVAGPDLGFAQIPSSSGANAWTLTNHGTSDVTVNVNAVSPSLPSSWMLMTTGTDANNNVTVPAGQTKTVTLDIHNTASNTIGFAKSVVYFSSSDGIGLTGKQASFFGDDTKDLVVDLSGNNAKYADLLSQMQSSGYAPAVIDDQSFGDPTNFSSWSQFNHIFYNLGDGLGQFANPGNLTNITSYVQSGGKFLLTGDWITGVYYATAQSLGDETYLNDIRNAFEVEPKAAFKNSAWSKINGITGDPISSGFNTTLAGRLLYRQPLGIAGPDAHAVFTNEKNDTIGVRAEMGQGKFVDLSFGADTVAAADRTTLMARIIRYFDAAAAVAPTASHALALDVAYPNPFNVSTQIGYTVNMRSMVTLSVRDLLGNNVATLVNRMQEPSHYTASLLGAGLPDGTYFYTLSTDNQKLEGKVTLKR